MITNNLFKHAQKELVMDAFLCWLANEADSNERWIDIKEEFLSLIGLENNKISTIQDIEARTQVDYMDLLIELKTPRGMEEIVFENKMWSTVHSKQLERYKEKKPDAAQYVYLKLGYLHRLDKQAARNAGYLIISAEQLFETLKPFKERHPFIREFADYLKADFVQPQKQFKQDLEDNNYEKFAKASFQQYVMDEIMDRLLGNGFEESNLIFRITVVR
ncbi:PD-(D/E)XK nuclease family protein [Halalkalibaculum sp. DA3122]|uniref:PD-(D/E)XK nuclease family protein n=1 Tax=Halalkalibaculum sp. DA3122 TaxID=3373607 RepID=UPI0037543765